MNEHESFRCLGHGRETVSWRTYLRNRAGAHTGHPDVGSVVGHTEGTPAHRKRVNYDACAGLEFGDGVTAVVRYPEVPTGISDPGRTITHRDSTEHSPIDRQLHYILTEKVVNPDASAVKDHAEWSTSHRVSTDHAAVSRLQRGDRVALIIGYPNIGAIKCQRKGASAHCKGPQVEAITSA